MHLRNFARLAIAALVATGASLHASQASAQERQQSGFGDLLVDTKFFVLGNHEARARFRLNRAAAEDGGADFELLPEVTFGLSDQWQLSIAEESSKAQGESFSHAAIIAEARYAFGRWGEHWLNPSVGFAYESVPNGPEVAKISFYTAEELNDAAWLWANSVTYQKRLSGDRERELIGKIGLHRVLSPNRFSIGAELKYESAKTYGHVSETATELLIGPALIWHPTENFTLRLGSFFGVTNDSPDNETTAMIEWYF